MHRSPLGVQWGMWSLDLSPHTNFCIHTLYKEYDFTNMQCPLCKIDGVHEDALTCPHCMKQIRERSDEEGGAIRKEETGLMKSVLINGTLIALFIAVIFGPLVFVLLS